MSMTWGLLESLQDSSRQDLIHHQTFTSPHRSSWTIMLLGSSEVSINSELVSKACVFPLSCAQWPQQMAPWVPLGEIWRNAQNTLILTFQASSWEGPGLSLSQSVLSLSTTLSEQTGWKSGCSNQVSTCYNNNFLNYWEQQLFLSNILHREYYYLMW